MITHFPAFLGVAVLVIVTPGQDTALTIRNTLLSGRSGGAATALGVATGQTLWTLAASAGLAALLSASQPAFLAVKLAGAAYLVFLGAQSLLAAFWGSGTETNARPGPARGTSRAAYRQGVLSNLGNPKMAVFFTSLLPQFTTAGHGVFWALLLLGLVFALMTLVWLTAYSIAVARAGAALRRGSARRLLDGLTGVALVGLGVRLATERR